MPDVSVRLKDIDENNWMEIVLLSSSENGEDKVVEKYTASNALSICQALYEETWEIQGVYCGRTPVGFVMYGYCRERDEYELCRLMIDRKHQNKGFGSIALKLCMERMYAEFEDCKTIYLLVNRENERAIHLYEKNGFKPTGECSGNDIIYYYSEEEFE